ncbi:MAG: Flp family type IVb pilin [Rhodobacteraceae bacterium]|nr:Flp family type IVb pilin [Paracoccaceae bacterium]
MRTHFAVYKQKLGALGRAFVDDEAGATAIEYAVIAGMISISIVTAVAAIGVTVKDDLYTVIESTISAAFGG